MAAVEPISSFPMEKEAAEEEIALLVRKPGFDDLTITDIIRHMNNRFNTSFESYKSQLKKMVIDEISKRNQEQSGSDSSDDSSGSDSDSDSDEEKDDKKKKKKADKPVKKEEKVLKKEVKEEVKEEVQEEVTESKPPKLPKHEDSDSDSGVDDAEVHTSASRKKKPVPEKKSAPDMASTIKSSRRAAASDALKQIRHASGNRYGNGKKKKEKDPNEDTSGKFGPMTKLCYISPELQQVTKDQWMKRCDVMKVMWDYIKENNLKDPKNGQFVICDDVLLSIFNKNRFKGFGMAKFLTKHIIGINDLVPEMREAAEAEMEKRRNEMKERERKRQQGEFETSRVSDSDGAGPSSKKPKVEEDSDDDDEKNGNDDGSSSSSSSESD